MLHALDTHEIYVSTNTACAGNTDSQSVMAVYNDLLRSKHTLRISLSYQTTTEEVNLFLKYFKEEYEKLSKKTTYPLKVFPKDDKISVKAKFSNRKEVQS